MPAQVVRQASSQSGFQWKRGEFHTFYAQMKVRVGQGHDVVDIEKGDEFEYDGSVCKYAGREFPQPQIRGAVREGWVTLDREGQKPLRFTASRDVAVSQSKTTDLSRVQRKHSQVMESDSLDEDTVIEVGDRNKSIDEKGRHQAPKVLSKENNRRASNGEHAPGTFRGMEVEQSDLDEQDHTEIAKVRSPASMTVDILKNPGVTEQIKNRSHEQGFGRASSVRRTGPSVTHREGVTITSNVGDVDPDVRSGDASDGKTVGKVRHSSSKRTQEGVSVEDTSGPRIGKKGSKKPEAPEAPAPAAVKAKPRLPADAPPKLKMAVRIHSGFPVDWNFFASPNDKLSRIKKLGATPELLDALHATESAAMKKVLEQKFSSHFS